MFGIKTKIKRFLKYNLGLWNGPELMRFSPVGYMCNHRCPMCWRMQLTDAEKRNFSIAEKNSLTITQYLQLLDKLPKTVKEIQVVGGGEPLLYPQITELFQAIKNKKVSTQLITNGVKLNDEICRLLVNIQWDEVRISIHASNPDIYKKVNGVDDFDQVINNISHLKLLRGNYQFPKIKLFYVIQRDNVSNIESFVKFATKLQVDSIEFDSLIPIAKNVLLTEKQIQQTILSLKRANHGLTLNNNIHNMLMMYNAHPKWNLQKHSNEYFGDKYCQIVQNAMEVSHDGTVVLCCLSYGSEIPIFSLKNMSIQDIWSLHRKYRKELARGKFYQFCYKLCNYGLEKLPFHG